RGGPATRYSAPVLVLEPGDIELGHRKPTAMDGRRPAAPSPGDRALRIARSAQAPGRCASIAGVSAVTTLPRNVRCAGRDAQRPTGRPNGGGVVNTVCCDMSALIGAVAEVSAAPPPKPAIACTS